MRKKQYILALDQGTTSSRALVFDEEANLVSLAQEGFRQYYPRPGWVEHDPGEILLSQVRTAGKAMKKAGVPLSQLAGIGITNQRETTVVWNRNTGKPVHPAIVWQDNRTADYMERMKEEGWEPYVRENTGLVLDTYFSASKLTWILDHVEGARKLAEKGDLLFGTIDTWLLWNLSGGKLHITDHSNASRTLLFNIRELDWDRKLLERFNISARMMPEVRSSSGNYGVTAAGMFPGAALNLCGTAGDQQAALFGQACLEKGMAKNTYGTGCFLLMNTGSERIRSDKGLLTTIAWNIGGETTYALEGSIFMAGAILNWLRDELGILKNISGSGEIAGSLADNDGVYLVPAFAGMGAPYWNMRARAAITGLTRGAGAHHIIRAGLEAIAYQTKDVVCAMEEDARTKIHSMKADGGASGNDFLLQFQSDILRIPVHRPSMTETTALGAAFLAGIAAGTWDTGTLGKLKGEETKFSPLMDVSRSDQYYDGWKKAVEGVMKIRQNEL